MGKLPPVQQPDWDLRLTEKKPTGSGRIEPPRKIYSTCTFGGLGSKKDEFLRKAVEAMKEMGLKEVPSVEPFEHHLGLKDALRIWDTSMFDELARQQMVGTDVLLAYDKEGTHKRMGLRVEPQNGNLRFGYFYGEKVDAKSARGIKFILGLFSWIIFILIYIILIVLFLAKPLYEAHGLFTLMFMMIMLSLLPQIPFIYLLYLSLYIKPYRRPQKEINQRIRKVAESLGGKRITPFKKTTVELED